ncbi:hypothetical protein HanPSC8_Chr02g0059031 [Helianthus annuus]|nr:hypothetical protein HanIR_Chr02g0067601 [Helianthus annuus]KAJ0951357.1 hypothetical protein HanPSC8_Chr02g0059031 [Helianthus annuus]
MIVSGQNRNASTRLPVPDTDSLIITSANDPRILMMKLNGPDIIEMAEKSKQTAMKLVVPYFDLVIISCINKKRLRLMKVHATNRTIMFIKPINERPHPVIP